MAEHKSYHDPALTLPERVTAWVNDQFTQHQDAIIEDLIGIMANGQTYDGRQPNPFERDTVRMLIDLHNRVRGQALDEYRKRRHWVAAATALGFQREDTGGNCEALTLTVGDDVLYLTYWDDVNEIGDPSLPVDGAPALFGDGDGMIHCMIVQRPDDLAWATVVMKARLTEANREDQS